MPPKLLSLVGAGWVQIFNVRNRPAEAMQEALDFIGL
jgi:hypothetical protein